MLLPVIVMAGCSLEKKNKVNRALQNLTAHYNILYNANEMLQQKQESYALAFTDSYTDLLSVYPDTTAQAAAPDKDLELVITKANKIIYEKEQSHYVGDAYLVLGKAYYLEGNYFNAAEYFSYVLHSFPNQTNLTQQATAWKVRSLLYLNNLPEAKQALDTAFKNVDLRKKITADIYAARLQYAIKVHDYADAEAMAENAIANCHNNNQKLRWTFILGQLQELNHKNTNAIWSYTRVVKSNAPFELAFNANLNRIRIQEEHNGIKISRTDALLKLLKDENNRDFTDQIYYQIATLYMLNKDIGNAVKYYKLSVSSSLRNQNQKGLSYLRMADIDFNYRADYVNAKKYYDSTLINLSPNYPGYQTIQKKSNNLQLLVDRLQIIAREDTLQMLAKLDEKSRLARIDELVNAQILQQQTIADNNAAAVSNAFNDAKLTPNSKPPAGTSFYFYNAAAVSRGYSDFKQRWGNRRLEDNWRRSSKASTTANNIANTTNVTTSNSLQGTAIGNDPDALPADMRKSKTDVSAGNYRQNLLQNLPLTPQLLAGSNTRIYNAYLDIANFYRDILEDKKEAISNYELLLNKFPDDPNKAALYYNLYRLYSDADATRSAGYKDLILKDYPQTIYAKVIIDPDYARRVDDNDARLNAAYNTVYDLYRRKKYAQVVGNADSLLQQYPGSKLQPQLAYLRAIAAGHQEQLPSFRTRLEQIISNYPDDKLITPLVKQHLAYIDANTAQFTGLPYAIMDADTASTFFIPPIAYQKETVYNRNRAFAVVTETPAAQKQAAPSAVIKENVAVKANQKPAVADKPAVKTPSAIFSLRDSTNYYFVINVSTGTTDLSSSRFGIGQFIRANFRPNTIKHQLKNAGPDNQLIYVGRFYSLAAVKDFARAIIPLLPDVMKVPKDKYSFFIITQENLDKLAGKKMLDNYTDYYQQTY